MNPVTTTAAELSYLHLTRMTTEVGLFEHALLDDPRLDHGYCVDDVARALALVVRDPRPTSDANRLAETYLAFLEAAVRPDGTSHNRRDVSGAWIDEPGIGDWWGRALGALGATVARSGVADHRRRAGIVFGRAAVRRSPDVRSSAFAALGAAAVLRRRRATPAALGLLLASVAVIPTAPTADWDWPEDRLRYANATLCEALITGGDVLGRSDLSRRGIELLRFLLDIESDPRGWLSPTGSEGRAPGQSGPLWDQQAIEVAALADASAAAHALTGDVAWLEAVRDCWAWFLGANDRGAAMYDAATGAGYDGLGRDGRNANRGAESTLAALSTLQNARRLGVA